MKYDTTDKIGMTVLFIIATSLLLAGLDGYAGLVGLLAIAWGRA